LTKKIDKTAEGEFLGSQEEDDGQFEFDGE